MTEDLDTDPAAEEPAQPPTQAEAPAAPTPTPDQTARKAPDLVMVHVRFSPDGAVVEIGERPPSLTPQAWFNRLSEKAGPGFQALSGGRGVFRLPREEVDELKALATN